jgi:hypothetical protein
MLLILQRFSIPKNTINNNIFPGFIKSKKFHLENTGKQKFMMKTIKIFRVEPSIYTMSFFTDFI